MRKVRVRVLPARVRRIGAEAWGVSPEHALIRRFRHRIDESWYAELLAELSLEGKRLDPRRARRLVLAALRKGGMSDGD